MSMSTPQTDLTGAAGQRGQLSNAGVPWVQFGDEVLALASDGLAPRMAERARSAGAPPSRVIETPHGERLHLVTQIGRVFQHDHPEVNVLYDRGRYLIVELDPEQARRLGGQPGDGYAVRPLAENSVVFDVRQPPALRAARLDWVQVLVERVERPPVEASLNRLVAFPTRHSTSSHYAEAAAWARDELQALGYATRLEPLPVGGGTTQNVIAERAGCGAEPRGLVLVVAHLDSVNHHGGPAAIAPGADDNGSGSAGVLEMARVLKDHPGKHDLHLILFGGEEQGLFGSIHHVARLSQADRDRLRGVVNMDMIGTLNTPTPAVLLEGAPVSQGLIDGLAAAAATYTGLTVQVSLEPFGSDHLPFINSGLPAVLTIEGTDGANPHEHTANDTLEHITYDLILEILRMNTAFVATALERQE
jgi:hypothetical protein